MKKPTTKKETPKQWKRLAILTPKELEIGQKMSRKFKISQEDIDAFKL